MSQEKKVQTVESLKELCYQSLAESVKAAPPGIQEMVMGTTVEKVRSEIYQTMYPIVAKELSEELQVLPALVPEAMEDIIQSMVTPGRLRTIYISPANSEVVNCAIHAAEQAVRQLEERYVHRAFQMYQGERSDADISEDEDSEGMWY